MNLKFIKYRFFLNNSFVENIFIKEGKNLEEFNDIQEYVYVNNIKIYGSLKESNFFYGKKKEKEIYFKLKKKKFI